MVELVSPGVKKSAKSSAYFVSNSTFLTSYCDFAFQTNAKHGRSLREQRHEEPYCVGEATVAYGLCVKCKSTAFLY